MGTCEIPEKDVGHGKITSSANKNIINVSTYYSVP